MENRTKSLRLDKNMKQELLARKLGTTQQTISKIENGKYMASADIFVDIATFFNVSVDYLLCLSNNKHNEFNCENYDKSKEEAEQLLFLHSHMDNLAKKQLLKIAEVIFSTID